MKLVFQYEVGDGCTYSCTVTLPFEYSSVVDFQYMVLEKVAKQKEKSISHYGKKDGAEWYRNGYIDVLGCDINTGDAEEYIENGVLTLDEWFDKNKTHAK